MPTIYVDTPFLTVVRNRKKRMERQAEGDAYVPEGEALETMLSEDALDEIERERGNDV